MAEPFEVCWQRVERAEAHNEAMARAWNTFIEDEPYEPVCTVNSDGTGRLFVVQVKPIPDVIGLELGEFLYQYRAALDSSIYELACCNSGDRPPANEGTLEFPICNHPAVFGAKKYQDKIAPLTDKQRSIVESVQPYNITPGMSPRGIPFSFHRALGILNDWARIDRHRRLHVASAWADNLQPVFIVPDGTSLVDVRVARPSLTLNHEAQVATFRIAGWKPGMNVNANPNLTFDIAISESPLPCHESDTLGQRLKCIQIAVRTILQELGQTVGIKGGKYARVGVRVTG